MQRRDFFKTLTLGVSALCAAKLTGSEVTALQEFPVPKLPLGCRKAYVTMVKGPVATVKHGFNTLVVFAAACNVNGRVSLPKSDVIDRNTVKLTFDAPTSQLKRFQAYKVVIGTI